MRNQLWISPREHYAQAWLAQIDKHIDCSLNFAYKHEAYFYGNTFSIIGPFCEEPRVTGGFPQKGSVMRSLDVSCDYFPAQRASNAENGSIWWRHHDLLLIRTRLYVFAGIHQPDELLKEDLYHNDVTWAYGTSTYRQFDRLLSPKPNRATNTKVFSYHEIAMSYRSLLQCLTPTRIYHTVIVTSVMTLLACFARNTARRGLKHY